MKVILKFLASLFLFLPVPAKELDNAHRLTVFFTNDLHGGIVPQKAEFLNPEFPPMLGGGPSAAAVINNVRTKAKTEGFSTLLIDAGDTFQGTLVGTLSKGKAIIEYMNMMKYDAVVPGNHDFDQGKDNLIELIKLSNFSWVAANIYNQETETPWEWVKPWVIVDKGGFKIGITGTATTGTEYMSFPENIRGLDFRNEIIYLQKAVDELHAKNVDLVVALVHTGLPYDPREGYEELKSQTKESVINSGNISAMEIAHYVKGVDILLGGHLHRGYREAWEDPVNHTICLQNYANGGNLGWANVYIDIPTRSIAGYDYAADQNALLLLTQDQFWPDSTVAEFVQEKQEIYEKDYQEVIGESPVSLNRSSLGESPLNNLICDVMLKAANADFSFMNFGGIRADIRPGLITREEIFKVLPFGNEIVSFQASGKFIKRIFEKKLYGNSRGLVIGGAKVVFNKELPNGQRVVSMEIDGEPLEPDRIYRVATNDYLMEGNSGLDMLKDIPRQQVDFTGILVSDAVIEYIRENSPVKAELDGRWQKDDNARPSAEWIRTFEEVPLNP
jgi:2',3'-cyclic-nucleotide 2'-phosphodiesterase (5'-nucleotidase family)